MPEFWLSLDRASFLLFQRQKMVALNPGLSLLTISPGHRDVIFPASHISSRMRKEFIRKFLIFTGQDIDQIISDRNAPHHAPDAKKALAYQK